MEREQSSLVLDHVLADIAEATNYNRWIFERARPDLGTRTLDAGAGIGTFSALAREAGGSVTALEPEPAFVTHLRDRFRGDPAVSVVAGNVESMPNDLGRFESILCFNVLEHVHDDSTALAVMREHLVANGKLLLLVPAHSRLYGGYDRAAGHVRRYSRRQLGRLLLAAGFESRHSGT